MVITPATWPVTPAASVTFKTSGNSTTAAVGVPVIWPVEVFSVSPAGRVPALPRPQG